MQAYIAEALTVVLESKGLSLSRDPGVVFTLSWSGHSVCALCQSTANTPETSCTHQADDDQPIRLHHCSAEEFVRFGEFMLSLPCKKRVANKTKAPDYLEDMKREIRELDAEIIQMENGLAKEKP